MSVYYSYRESGFYPSEMRKRYDSVGAWPEDAVRLTDAQAESVRKAISEGKAVEKGESGPVFKNKPAPEQGVPDAVSRFQARAALHNAGKLADIETAIGQADTLTQIAWADATEFRRQSPTILDLGAALDLDLDALFIAASKIEA